MNRLTRPFALSFLMITCIASVFLQPLPAAFSWPDLRSQSSPKEISQLTSSPEANFGSHFRDLHVEGSILIYDPSVDQFYQHNSERNATDFLPGSTFKILNSLIALETGVIADDIAVLTWDGIQRKVPAWNRDLNMREAIKLSAIWFYQVLARRVGHERMQRWVSQVEYGNQEIGDADDIDKFWLEGKLRITPQGQIQFLRRFYSGELPFSERSFAITKDIIIIEQTPDYTIRGKTGWVGFADHVEPKIGWFVGYLEKGNNVYFFSTNIDIRNDDDAPSRIELMRLCFKDLGLL
ncbi:MAG: class D beta-lactamase [Nodosilinea sp.]